jgi:hypothetical protein
MASSPEHHGLGQIEVSAEKQASEAVKETTVIIHIHQGDAVFIGDGRTYRIGQIGEMLVASRSYTSTTTNSPGAATAQGDGAAASGSAGQAAAKPDIDLDELAGELARLRGEMRKRADGSRAHDKAIAAVADAEDSAQAKDEPALRGYLVKAGAWTLDVARDVGLAVAADYLKDLFGVT